MAEPYQLRTQMATHYRRPRPGHTGQFPHQGVVYANGGSASWNEARQLQQQQHQQFQYQQQQLHQEQQQRYSYQQQQQQQQLQQSQQLHEQYQNQQHQEEQQHYNNNNQGPGPGLKYLYKEPVIAGQPSVAGPPFGMPLGGDPNIPIGSPMAVMPTTPRAQKPRSKSEEAISDLLLRIPDIGILFDVHSRIGNGTFSTVLLATLRRESHLPDNVRRKFAIKHHIPTSHPDRIMKELQCMTKMGGTNNVVGIHCCLRCDASAAFVMPYMAHDRFHDFFTRMDVSEIRLYMRNLLIALRHVHKFDIIHRDVKPSNFLYNRRRREFLLVDFGLAQHVTPSMGASSAGIGAVGKRAREGDHEEQPMLGGGAAGTGIPMEVPPADAELGGAVKRMRLEDGIKMPLKPINEIAQGEAPPADFGNPNAGLQPTAQQLQQQPEQNYNAPGGTPSGSKYNTNRNAAGSATKCFCFANPSVCLNCLMKKEVHASRAGTPGYRPPEVLLKYPDQTTAVDVWAAGVIFLSIMSSVYPFFKAPNDFVALAEIVTIFGDQAIRKTALALERMVTLSQRSRPLSLRKLCLRFRHRRVFSDDKLHRSHANQDGQCEVCRNCDQYYFNCLCEDTEYNDEPLDAYECFPATAYDLLHRLLEVNPHKRITAAEALQHPFFTAAEGQDQAVTAPIPCDEDPLGSGKQSQAESRKLRRQRYPKVAGAPGNEQLKQQLEVDVHATAYEKL